MCYCFENVGIRLVIMSTYSPVYYIIEERERERGEREREERAEREEREERASARLIHIYLYVHVDPNK